jgi:hypothetical protein
VPALAKSRKPPMVGKRAARANLANSARELTNKGPLAMASPCRLSRLAVAERFLLLGPRAYFKDANGETQGFGDLRYCALAASLSVGSSGLNMRPTRSMPGDRLLE